MPPDIIPEKLSFGEAFGAFFTRFFGASSCVELMVFAFVAISLAGTFKKRKVIVFQHIGFYLAVFGLTVLFMDIGFSIAEAGELDPYRALLIVVFSLIPGAIYLGIFSKGNVWHRILRISYYLSVCYVVSEIGHNYNILIANAVGDNRTLMEFLFCLPYLILVPISIWTGRLKLHHVEHFSSNLSILSALVFTFSLTIAYLSSRFDTDQLSLRGWLILVLVLLMLIDVYGFGMHYVIDKRDRTISELNARAQLNEAASIMLALNEESIAQTTRARHDLKNTLSYLRDAITADKKEDALAFINETIGKAYGDMPIVDCGNRVVSSIMNLELSKAKLKAVELRYRLVVPKTLPISDGDLCSLITNIIDNAIEGALDSKKEGYIDFSIVATNSLLRIQCKNPTKRTSVPTFSSKSERGHGFGVSIIKSIVKEHKGYYEFSIVDGTFIVDCVLDLDMNKEANNA